MVTICTTSFSFKDFYISVTELNNVMILIINLDYFPNGLYSSSSSSGKYYYYLYDTLLIYLTVTK
jgi:hypothetical protein